MPVDLSTFVKTVDPSRTVLLFGAGAAIPSGAPSVQELQRHFETQFGVSATDYSLAEQTGIIEQKARDRRRLIEELQSRFRKLRPMGALLNLPLYDWKSIYSTNYDELVEQSYQRRSRPIVAYSTNFDFGLRADPTAVQYFKLHGTISKDVCFGDRSRIILTEGDYDLTEEYRELLYDRLKSDIAASHLIIIGHSLADPDIRSIIQRALSLSSKSGAPGRISLLLYTRDEGRAALVESRGVEVVFGGLDDFFAGLVSRIDTTTTPVTSPDPLDHITALRPSTVDVVHALSTQRANVSAMYNGWPASYGDIEASLTFRRNVADEIVTQFQSGDSIIAVIVGPSGVGKTTAARQAVKSLSNKGYFAWEHKEDQLLLVKRWLEVAAALEKDNSFGVLFIDEAHAELTQVNDLLNSLNSRDLTHLKIIACSTNHQWGPRVKSPVIFKSGATYHLNKVVSDEIDRLLTLVEQNDSLRLLVERTFAGYSRPERRRRLTERCAADMFVCLKNIFSSEKFDDIILREYADLDPSLQEIYKAIAAMESSGVHVHRQLVIRLLGINSMQIGAVLAQLADIVHEQSVDEKMGIYAWRGRHKVIMNIVAEHKYYDTNKRYDLYDKVIEAISPTYDIEIRTIRELCNIDSGIALIPQKDSQNVLLRKMISVAPGERVPRHRLIRNLIDLGEFDAADTEIKAFRTDFSFDAPTKRYQIKLATARAVRAKGLMLEDRIALIGKAQEVASEAANRYKTNKGVLAAYCEVGIETAKLTGDMSVFDAAIALLKNAEEDVGDPEISRMISRLEARMASLDVEPSDFMTDDLADE